MIHLNKTSMEDSGPEPLKQYDYSLSYGVHYNKRIKVKERLDHTKIRQIRQDACVTCLRMSELSIYCAFELLGRNPITTSLQSQYLKKSRLEQCLETMFCTDGVFRFFFSAHCKVLSHHTVCLGSRNKIFFRFLYLLLLISQARGYG